jgi:hypothetical protein
VKGDLPLIPAAKALQDELMGPAAMPAADDAVLGENCARWTRSRRPR